MLSDEQLAAGANAVSVVGPLAAAIVFAIVWRAETKLRFPDRSIVAMRMFGLIALGMVCIAFTQAYWQIYYSAVLAGNTELAAWALRNQDIPSLIRLAGGIVAGLHLWYPAEQIFGQNWWLLVLGGLAASFALGAITPVAFAAL